MDDEREDENQRDLSVHQVRTIESPN
jgi:hypothetical protein